MDNAQVNKSTPHAINIKPLKIYLLFLIIMSPIFINLDISGGLKFDVNVVNKGKAPSLPLSAFFILILFLFNFKAVTKSKVYIFFFLCTLFMTMFSVAYGNQRIIIIFLQMNIFLISYGIFKNIFKNYDKKILLNIFFRSISLVILIKFIFDILLFNSVNSPFFINNTLAIYNYYSYFPFIYFLGGILSLRNFLYKEMFILSLLVFTVSLISLLETHSRLFTFSFYLVPFLIIFFRATKFNNNIIFNLNLLIVVIFTFYFAFNPNVTSELSMISRFEHWGYFLFSLNVNDLLFPFMNDYRMTTIGSLHNELLEIFSYFGLVSLLFLRELYKIFTNERIVDSYSMVIKLLIFVLLFGMLIQINILNPYLAVLVPLFLSLTHLSTKPVVVEKKSRML